MTDTDRAMRRVEHYLRELRADLRALPDGEASDIVRELRAHILERAAPTGAALTEEAVAAALERLGPPSQVASLYATESMLKRGTRRGMLWIVARWAAGSFAALGLLVGAVVSTSFFVAALRKPFAPDRAGLWRLTDGSYSLRLGFGGLEAGHELLGWWIVPLGLLLGAGMVWLTLHVLRLFLQHRRRAPLEAL